MEGPTLTAAALFCAGKSGRKVPLCKKAPLPLFLFLLRAQKSACGRREGERGSIGAFAWGSGSGASFFRGSLHPPRHIFDRKVDSRKKEK